MMLNSAMTKTTKILIVEDDPSDALLVELALKSFGNDFSITRAERLEQALKLIGDAAFDVILLDLSLPDSFGLEGLDRVICSAGDAALVVLTGFDDGQAALEALERGAQDYLIKGEWSADLLQRSLRYAIQRQMIQIENKRLFAQIQRQARYDSLTQVLNRHSLTQELEREWSRAVRSRQPLSCVMMDIDHFKSINDTYGHAAGDHVLSLFGEQLRNHSRASDLLARYGGEEFCALLPDTNEADAVSWADRCRLRIAHTPVKLANGLLNLTVSFGVAERTDHIHRPSELIDLADQALLFAKRSGRNQVVAYGTHNVLLEPLSMGADSSRTLGL